VSWFICRIPSWPLAALVSAAIAFGGPCATSLAAEPTFVIGTEQTNTYFALVFRKVFTEAFRRLAIPVEIVDYPLPRLAWMLEQGQIDAEASRGASYGQAHPRLVRVDESLMDARWVLYTARPELKISGLDDLVRLHLEGSWRRGVLVCEQTLKPLLQADRVTDVSEADQGLNLLVAGRTDFYCDVDVNMDEKLRLPRYRGARQVRELWVLGNSPLYTYLHPRHAALAPRLAEVLRQMKAEGLVDRYRQEARREVSQRP
jgi:polar amino acid transport system substrate-binding protein